jgi:hypothetical protein
MMTSNGPTSPAVKQAGHPRSSATQDMRTVRNLRLGVGAVGTLLPVALIAGNWLLDERVIVPSSMSGTYYTGTRNLFVGSLCALGVFLMGYRHTERQNRYTWLAGVCAVLVAFAPTAPALPKKEPSWVNYLHHAAAGTLILTLGLFCLVVFMDGRRRHWRGMLHLICGFVVLAAGALALYTGLRPTSWSTGWPSLYCFEAIAVFAFGTAWITAGLELAHHLSPAAADGHAVATRPLEGSVH